MPFASRWSNSWYYRTVQPLRNTLQRHSILWLWILRPRMNPTLPCPCWAMCSRVSPRYTCRNESSEYHTPVLVHHGIHKYIHLISLWLPSTATGAVALEHGTAAFASGATTEALNPPDQSCFETPSLVQLNPNPMRNQVSLYLPISPSW